MKLLLATTALAAVLSAPALAQDTPNYHTNPTPAERAQTQQLNDAAAQDAQTPPAQPAAAPAPPQADDPAYRADKAAADRNWATYHAERATYDRDHPGFDRRFAAFSNADDLHGIALMPDDRLMDRRVLARDDTLFGRVGHVERDDQGQVSRVLVALRDGHTVWVDPRDLRINVSKGALYTELSHAQLDDMAHNRRID